MGTRTGSPTSAVSSFIVVTSLPVADRSAQVSLSSWRSDSHQSLPSVSGMCSVKSCGLRHRATSTSLGARRGAGFAPAQQAHIVKSAKDRYPSAAPAKASGQNRLFALTICSAVPRGRPTVAGALAARADPGRAGPRRRAVRSRSVRPVHGRLSPSPRAPPRMTSVASTRRLCSPSGAGHSLAHNC